MHLFATGALKSKNIKKKEKKTITDSHTCKLNFSISKVFMIQITDILLSNICPKNKLRNEFK